MQAAGVEWGFTLQAADREWCSPCRMQIESLMEIKWHVAVFDEAHKLKNDGSATYQTASMLQKVTSRLYGLSGTVMQVILFSAATCCPSIGGM